MLYAEVEPERWLDRHETASERRKAELARHLNQAREASRTPSIRQLAGEALIAFGVRLAGNQRTPSERRSLASRPL